MRIIDIIFVRRCIICGQKGHDLCDKCLQEASKFYITNDVSENIICGYKYKEPLRGAFLKFKFNGRKGYSRGLSKLFLEKLKHIDFEEFDIITFVPISKMRMRERGYNQSELLAKEICKFFDTKPKAILKRRNSKKQSSLMAEDRKVNIIDKFALIEDIHNKKILVIDDVYTTGSTMGEVIKVINCGNPNSVIACALFKT